tara:strand:- start:1442 stop:2323 length:882 start_codon:yes stop_codon:yes gene_type:complete
MVCVSVFIVNYNGARFITDCLESLLASKTTFDLDIIVIDNCSTDDSLDVLAVYKDRITVLKNYHNSGFSKGNNIAATYAKGDYYFLLNNDTVLYPDTIQLLYDYMIQFSDIGALVPKLLNEDGTVQCPGSIFGQWKFLSKTPKDVSFVAGAALLIKRSVYDAINGLDDNLFFYNDDVDLCAVLRKKKLRLVYYPLAKLTHFGGLSTSFRKIGCLTEGYRGGFYVCYKHYPRFIYALYRVFVLFDILPRLLIHVVLSIFIPLHRSYVCLYQDVLKINWKNDIFVSHPPVKVDVL